MFQRRVQTQELQRLLDDFDQAHTNLLHRINALSNNLRTARLVGYSSRNIEHLIVIIKVFKLNIFFEEKQNINF
ncbi:unnamed protein product [Rotaria sp. Silwood2]|nr:unnamed protein product [Rotaria sp. Silwood2]